MGIGRIGSDDDSALLCLTDKTDCCNSTLSPDGNALGNWYFANGEALEDLANSMAPRSLFVTRGQSVVRLLQLQPASTMELGQLYCEVPDTQGVHKRVSINLCKLCIIATLLTVMTNY